MASDAAPPAWKGLHPASVAVNVIPRIWGAARQAWPLLLAFVYGRASGSSLFDLLLIAFFLMWPVAGTVLHYLTLRYRVADGRLEIATGLLNRQVRVISPDRIQNTELVRNVFHKMSGLVEVRIETASGTEVEGLLSALSVDDAESLVGALEAARRIDQREATEEIEPPVLVRNDLRDLIRFGVTATRIGALAVIGGVAAESLQWANPEQLQEVGGVLGKLGGIALFIAVVTGTWLLGTGASMLRHYRYRLLQRGGTLVSEEGLLTRRQVELPLKKVQLVTVSEPWPRRLLGFGSIHIETAAAREGGGGTTRAEAMIPVVDQGSLYEVAAHTIPSIDVDLAEAKLHPPARKALIRSEIASITRATILAVVVSWWLFPWGLLAWLLVPLAVLFAWLDHRYQGWLITDEIVVARRGYLHRRTQIVARRKLQSMELSQGIVLRRYGLGELALRVAGSTIALPILSWDDAARTQLDLLTARSGRPPGGPAAVAPATPPAQYTDSPPPTASSPTPAE